MRLQLHPAPARGQRQVHVIAAWAWFAFGVYGLIEYTVQTLFHVEVFDVANSIPVLFFISVYANFVGHLASAQGARARTSKTTDSDEPSE